MPPQSPKNRQRKRRITWFNPPFCKSVKTKIGCEFLNLVESCFPKTHPLSKIINKNTVKISPSCMPNMGAKIASLNKQKLKSPPVDNHDNIPGCKCRQNPCPLGGQCEKNDLVYKATLQGGPKEFFYFGSCSTKFSKRYANHKHSLTNRNSKQGTILSQKFWELRDQGLHPTVSFSIYKESRSAESCAKRCNLCLSEKLAILDNISENMLNVRTETFSRCKHRARWKVLH